MKKSPQKALVEPNAIETVTLSETVAEVGHDREIARPFELRGAFIGSDESEDVAQLIDEVDKADKADKKKVVPSAYHPINVQSPPEKSLRPKKAVSLSANWELSQQNAFFELNEIEAVTLSILGGKKFYRQQLELK